MKLEDITDVNLNYTALPGDMLISQLSVIRGENANIIMTTVGSCTFEPLFGSIVPELLFDPLGNKSVTAWKIETGIFQALRKWQPRIILDERQSRVSVQEPGNVTYTYIANLLYYIRELNLTANQVLGMA